MMIIMFLFFRCIRLMILFHRGLHWDLGDPISTSWELILHFFCKIQISFQKFSFMFMDSFVSFYRRRPWSSPARSSRRFSEVFDGVSQGPEVHNEIQVAELGSKINDLEEESLIDSGRARIAGIRTKMELARQKERESQKKLIPHYSSTAHLYSDDQPLTTAAPDLSDKVEKAQREMIGIEREKRQIEEEKNIMEH